MPDPVSMPPLGYADLEEDEALIVSIYRQWRQQEAPRADVEAQIDALLRGDRLHGALAALFALFSGLEAEAGAGAAAVLGPAEERMLAALGDGGEAARACRAAFAGSGVALRPLAAIPRTGRDWLETALAGSYLSMTHYCPPDPASG